MSDAAMQTEGVRDLSSEAFAQWRHHPVTRTFLRFLADQAENDAEVVKGLWANGLLTGPNPHPAHNPDYLRGRYLALIETTNLTAETIQNFYAAKAEDEAAEER